MAVPESSLVWFVVQVHPWSVKKRRSEELASEIRRRLKDQTLQVFYGVFEDEVKKYNSPFDEYLFVEYRAGMFIPELKDEDHFMGILKNPSGHVHLVDNVEVERIRSVVFKPVRYRRGDWVEIQEGAHAGCLGEVVWCADTEIDGHSQIVVRITLGDSVEETAIPSRWAKRKKRR